jgi:hypothetical protein
MHTLGDDERDDMRRNALWLICDDMTKGLLSVLTSMKDTGVRDHQEGLR